MSSINKNSAPHGGTRTFNSDVEGSTPSARTTEPTLEQLLQEISEYHDLNPLETHHTSPVEDEVEIISPTEKKMRAYLKIKIKSLAAEAKIIRAEEQKYKRRKPKKDEIATLGTRAKKRGISRLVPGSVPNTIFWGLRSHRIHDVRWEARAACLAYGFLRGHNYSEMETKCYKLPNFLRVEELAMKYGEGDSRNNKQKFSEWLDGARNYLISKGWNNDDLPKHMKIGLMAAVKKLVGG